MRILHVVPTYLPAVRYGGPIVSVHGLCKALAKQGHDVHVFTTNVDGPGESAVLLEEAVDLDGVKVRYFPSTVLRRLYWSPRMLAALERDVGSFDIVHTHSVFLWPTWAAARAARNARIPYVLAPRGMFFRDLVQRRSRWVKSAWIRFVERRNLESAAAIHVTSRLEAEALEEFGFTLRRVCIAPNGIDLPSGEGATPETGLHAGERPYILYLGRINWKKGIDRLIESLPWIPNVLLVIAGNDEDGYKATLLTAIVRLGLTDRVHFTGAVYGIAKQALLRNAIAVVVPSIAENFGNVVLEAMAAGRPVVTTRGVGAAEIVLEAGAGLVVEGEPQALAAGIAGLVADPQLACAMGARGRKAVLDTYSWDAAAKATYGIYEDVLRATGSTP